MNWRFFLPLVTFVVGMILLALSTLAYPLIAGAVDTTRASIAASGINEANYPGLTWEFTATRLLIFLAGLFNVLISVGIVWLRRR